MTLIFHIHRRNPLLLCFHPAGIPGVQAVITGEDLPIKFGILPVTPINAQDLASTRPENVGMSSERLERLSFAMQRYVDEHQLSGAVVQVARRGRTVYRKAFGQLDIDESVPMTTDAIFRIASQMPQQWLDRFRPAYLP